MQTKSDVDTATEPDTDSEQPGWQTVGMTRRDGDRHTPGTDTVADEWPVALVFNGISHAVMMCTPRDLESLARGFALTEGIVARSSDIQDIEVYWHRDSAEVQLTIVQKAFAELKGRRRALAGRTGCGICGIESIDMLDLVPERVADVSLLERLAPDAIARALRELPAHQPLMRKTGGLHAAAWCSPEGEILHAFEDVGRHNALDKLIGRLAQLRVPPGDGFVLMSSRASYELVRKTARMQIPLLATVSAPTALAISIARQAGIGLVSFSRANGSVEYVRPSATTASAET